MRHLDGVPAVILETDTNARVVGDIEIRTVQIRRSGGSVDHVPVAVVQSDNVDLVVRPQACGRRQANGVAGRVIPVGVVNAFLQEDAVGKHGHGRARQASFRAHRTEHGGIIDTHAGEGIGRFKTIDDLDQEMIVRTAGQLHDGRGGIDIEPAGIVITRVQQHGGRPDEIAAVQRAAVLEHIRPLPLRRGDVGIVDSQLARHVAQRSQNRRIRDSHGGLDRNELRPVFERVHRAVDRPRLRRREEIPAPSVDKQWGGIRERDIEIRRIGASRRLFLGIDQRTGPLRVAQRIPPITHLRSGLRCIDRRAVLEDLGADDCRARA